MWIHYSRYYGGESDPNNTSADVLVKAYPITEGLIKWRSFFQLYCEVLLSPLLLIQIPAEKAAFFSTWFNKPYKFRVFYIFALSLLFKN